MTKIKMVLVHHNFQTATTKLHNIMPERCTVSRQEQIGWNIAKKLTFLLLRYFQKIKIEMFRKRLLRKQSKRRRIKNQKIRGISVTLRVSKFIILILLPNWKSNPPVKSFKH